MASARQGKWADAREKFKSAEFAITSLPIDLQRIVIADAMRASIEVKDYPGAAKRASELEVIGIAPEQAASVGVLRGRLAEGLGHEKDALDDYKRAASRRIVRRPRKPSSCKSRCSKSATRSARTMRCASSRPCRSPGAAMRSKCTRSK